LSVSLSTMDSMCLTVGVTTVFLLSGCTAPSPVTSAPTTSTTASTTTANVSQQTTTTSFPSPSPVTTPFTFALFVDLADYVGKSSTASNVPVESTLLGSGSEQALIGAHANSNWFGLDCDAWDDVCARFNATRLWWHDANTCDPPCGSGVCCSLNVSGSGQCQDVVSCGGLPPVVNVQLLPNGKNWTGFDQVCSDDVLAHGVNISFDDERSSCKTICQSNRTAMCVTNREIGGLPNFMPALLSDTRLSGSCELEQCAPVWYPFCSDDEPRYRSFDEDSIVRGPELPELTQRVRHFVPKVETCPSDADMCSWDPSCTCAFGQVKTVVFSGGNFSVDLSLGGQADPEYVDVGPWCWRCEEDTGRECQPQRNVCGKNHEECLDFSNTPCTPDPCNCRQGELNWYEPAIKMVYYTNRHATAWRKKRFGGTKCFTCGGNGTLYSVVQRGRAVSQSLSMCSTSTNISNSIV